MQLLSVLNLNVAAAWREGLFIIPLSTNAAKLTGYDQCGQMLLLGKKRRKKKKKPTTKKRSLLSDLILAYIFDLDPIWFP